MIKDLVVKFLELLMLEESIQSKKGYYIPDSNDSMWHALQIGDPFPSQGKKAPRYVCQAHHVYCAKVCRHDYDT